MFQLKDYNDPESNLQIIKLGNGSSSLEICPNYGGAVLKLILNGHKIIQAPAPINDPNTYAGAVLFPFANRVERGFYKFEGEPFQLNCNEHNQKNAIHGLVYNQSFKVVDHHLVADEASVLLTFNTAGKQFTGFPFQFEMRLRYVLKPDALVLKVCIKNTDAGAFPFSLGWHPYFFTEQTQDRRLELLANSRFVNNEAQVPVSEAHERISELLVNKFYDDCFQLESPELTYHNHDYRLKLHSDSKDNFLQVFTPEDPRYFAIEYMTAPANCFNNHKGLLTLSPEESYKTTWTLQLI
jgi:aldose 1-epimerase